MQRVLLITGHVYASRRRAGFHFLAEAFHRAGWDVTFLTVAISRLSRLRGDYRMAYLAADPPNRPRRVEDRLTSFIWYTPWHPAHLRSDALNRLSRSWFSRYGDLPLGEAEAIAAGADLMVFESTPGIMLFDRLKQLSPRARFVYRVSDDLRYLRNHPIVIETEDRVAPLFDLVSVPCEYIHRRFANLPTARLHPHAIRKELFDRRQPRPFHEDGAHVIFTGNAYFDSDFLSRAARVAPECRFHIFGDIADLPTASNITAYGEAPFADTVPYLQHADIGLQCLAYRPGAESFTDSLKVVQYTYCRLPIVAPDFLRSTRTNFFHYRPGDDAGIRRALMDARAMDRSTIHTDDIHSWDELATDLAGPPRG